MPFPARYIKNLQSMLGQLVRNGIYTFSDNGAPVSGVTGANVMDVGSTYIDYTTGITYVNQGTKASPSWVQLSPGSSPGGDLTARIRVTLAQLNAGFTLLPALPGLKYQLNDATMIAIGGAAGGTTTVNILGTQAAASAKLLAVAIAALTQSAVVRAGAANATVLTDGASFAPNDVNTAITTGVTGAALTTLTAIDFILNYSIVH